MADDVRGGAASERRPAADHPYTDPGDGRTECDRCGKWVWLVTHSCKGIPVTEAARRRAMERRVVELETLLDEVLRTFVHRGHPGQACLQSGWIPVGTVDRWRKALGGGAGA